MSDTLALLHGEAHERAPGVGRNGVVAVAGSFSATLERSLLFLNSVCGRLGLSFLAGGVGFIVVACLLSSKLGFGRGVFRHRRDSALHDLSGQGIFEHTRKVGLKLVPLLEKLIGRSLPDLIRGFRALHKFEQNLQLGAAGLLLDWSLFFTMAFSEIGELQG